MSTQCERHNVVLLGSGGCGKSTIIRNYLFGTTDEKYIETVEEFYTQRYTFDGRRTYVDFIDTAGSIGFPSMQELYIKKATGFILVYSLTDRQSFYTVMKLWDRIRQVKTNLLTIPCVVIGTKLDIENYDREIETSEALTWSKKEQLEGRLLEISGKDETKVWCVLSLLLQQLGTFKIQQNQMIYSNTRKKKRNLKKTKKDKAKKTDTNNNLETKGICLGMDSSIDIQRRYTMESSLRRFTMESSLGKPSRCSKQKMSNNKGNVKRKFQSFFTKFPGLNCLSSQSDT